MHLLKTVRRDLHDTVMVCEAQKKANNYLRSLMSDLAKGTVDSYWDRASRCAPFITFERFSFDRLFSIFRPWPSADFQGRWWPCLARQLAVFWLLEVSFALGIRYSCRSRGGCCSAGILPREWRRYTVPSGLTVLQWVADFGERVKQLQKVSQAANSGGAKGLKVPATPSSPGTSNRK